MRSFRTQFVGVLSALVMMTLAAGCDKVDEGAEVNAPAAIDKSGAKTPVNGKEKNLAKDDGEAPKKGAAKAEEKGAVNFTVAVDAVSVVVGADGEARIAIKTADGFKINKDYPWKASVTEIPGLEFKEKSFSKDKWTLNDKDAALTLPVTAKEAGEKDVEAKLSFSVCNDSRCDVIRDHKVTLKVAAK